MTNHLQPELVEAAEHAEIRAHEGNVRHVEVFRMGGVRTPIIERPRPSPQHRRAEHYTLKSEEPVIGADSEQLIIANRHGGDRKNEGGKMFDYLSGSLEHSFAETETDCVLDKCGVREHACALLDSGEEAFQRRKQKYNI